jgi:anti-sigma-K factor RskA
MNTIDPSSNPPEGENTAAEYVLGVLAAPERRAAQARISSDTNFAREVSSWETRFMPLVEEIAPVAVPEYVWARIRSALHLAPAGKAQTTPKPTLWESLAFWRWIASGALATAAAFAIALFVVPRSIEQPAGASMVSTLAHDDGSPGFVAIIDAARAQLTITPLAAAPTDGRVPELWLIPPGQAPRSLGVLDATRAQVVHIPEHMLAELTAQALFAVSLEPQGGAPHGAPTGPIIAKGGVAVL